MMNDELFLSAQPINHEPNTANEHLYISAKPAFDIFKNTVVLIVDPKTGKAEKQVVISR